MTIAPLWEIPSTWEWIPLSEVARVVGGGTPNTKDASFWEGGDIPWITPRDLSGYREKYISHGERSITALGLEQSGAVLMPPGTVLFSSRAPIGYTAIARTAISTNQGFKSFIPEGGLDSEYLYYFLTCAKQTAEGMASGTTFLELSGNQAGRMPLPLPPLPEQRRIVAELEKQLSRLDAAVEALRRAQRNLRRFRDSVLKAACEGKLVPTEAELARREGREYEPASKLLERILAERRRRWEEAELAKLRAKGKEPKNDKWKARYKEPAPPKTDGLPALPEGWCWATLGHVCEVQGGIQKQPSRRPERNKFPFLRVANVYRDRLELADVHEIELFPGEIDTYRLRRGDLLIVEGNGSAGEIGRMAVWDGSIANAVHQNHLIRARPLDGFSHVFATAYWNSSEGAARVLELAKSTSGLFTLSVSKVESLPIPVPPQAEQERIATALASAARGGEEAEGATRAGLDAIAALRQSLLREAFSGRLVPQDPNDEPASVLLARIRAEREAAARERMSSPSSRRGRRAARTEASSAKG